MPQLAKYELLEELGHGGMATVYRARDRRLGREVAVKVIHPHLRESREVVSRFHAEAKAVAKLRHPNIVDVYDVSEPDEPDQYLVVGLVRGTTLRKLLQERGAMPPEIAAALGLELLAAIAHANANGVVHRDVKPENVLVERGPERPASGSSIPPQGSRDSGDQPHADRHDGGPQERSQDRPHDRAHDDRSHEGHTAGVAVKLTDFGIAKLLDVQGVTSTGQVLGSPAHMAPEQIEGGEVDARSDVFGVGVLLYECMVGHLPFDGNNPAQVLRRVLDGEYREAQRERPVVGACWSRILDRALAHAPADRYADATAMRDALAAELQRIDLGPPERGLEDWIEDPKAYGDTHDKKRVDRLCALANDARRRGDALAAAADYNRALAQVPDDPNLLRIVAGMNRAERRSRALRKGAWIAGALALAGGGVVLAPVAVRSLRGSLRGAPAASMEVSGALSGSRGDPAAGTVVGATKPGSSAAAAGSNEAPERGSEEGSRGPGIAASSHAKPAPHDVARVTERHLTLDLKPPMGVTVSVDGLPGRLVDTGDALTLGTRSHVLAFSCSVCTPVQTTVDPGERDTTLVVSVPIEPAILIIDGDVSRTYQLVEHPEVVVRAGTNAVALRSVYEPVTVKQIETGDSVSVRLEAAKTMRASFQ
jgi:serine/threonine-protein kinase